MTDNEFNLYTLKLLVIAIATLTGCANELPPSGILQIHTNYPYANWSVTGEFNTEIAPECEPIGSSDLELGQGYICEGDLPIGNYVLTGEAVGGYEQPLYVTFTIDANEVKVVDFFYEDAASHPEPAAADPDPQAPITGDLMVGMNEYNGGFMVVDVNANVVTSQLAGNCPWVGDYFSCEMVLPIGVYSIKFLDMSSPDAEYYETPDDWSINLTEWGTNVFGIYEFSW